MAASRVRIGVVGARRGRAGIDAMRRFPEKMELVAICDPDEASWSYWLEVFPEVETFRTFEDLLDAPQVDAIVIATPLQLHHEQTVQALGAGKHVLCEVPAGYTLEQGLELIETVKQTGLCYMMAENYCFMRPNMMVLEMVRQGAFGELIHMEGGYIHDCRTRLHTEAGQLTWRGRMFREWNTVNYPTHSIGPLAKWLEAASPAGDRFDFITAITSSPKVLHHHFRDVFGSDHPGADPGYWAQGDSQVAMIRTMRGVTVTLRVDWTSPRPHNVAQYALQGTKGAYVTGRHPGETPLVWLEGLTPSSADGEAQWEPLWTHRQRFEHPLWKALGEEAQAAGHGGGDLFVLAEFVDSILEGRRPYVDVYDAVTWSAILPLAAESIRRGGQPVRFPHF